MAKNEKYISNAARTGEKTSEIFYERDLQIDRQTKRSFKDSESTTIT